MGKGKRFLDNSIIKARVEARMKQVRELHFLNGAALVIGENGKLFKKYADGRKIQVEIDNSIGV
jgi:polysaccharide deacetylase 2 family uncharacterized protein YibQ